MTEASGRTGPQGDSRVVPQIGASLEAATPPPMVEPCWEWNAMAGCGASGPPVGRSYGFPSGGRDLAGHVTSRPGVEAVGMRHRGHRMSEEDSETVELAIHQILSPWL